VASAQGALRLRAVPSWPAPVDRRAGEPPPPQDSDDAAGHVCYPGRDAPHTRPCAGSSATQVCDLRARGTPWDASTTV
jgi:hypothetical protein